MDTHKLTHDGDDSELSKQNHIQYSDTLDFLFEFRVLHCQTTVATHHRVLAHYLFVPSNVAGLTQSGEPQLNLFHSDVAMAPLQWSPVMF